MAMLLLAIGLVLIVEGLVYVLAPSLVERLLEMLRLIGEDQRRLAGLAAVALGLVLVWLAFRLGL
ncbi:DUF2065 domain-containing protein [Cribrihabitans pelagius]|uniref:DUF2065 domain-containing protein n=1 Tax=Cribrihabitans pelagius TaxID=1765746 RepID=UPI003B5C2BC0